MTLHVRPGAAAVVTGASSGIGEAIAGQLAARRIPLVLVARSREKLESLAAGWRAAYGVPVEVLAIDLAAPEGAACLFAATEGAGKPVDLLVNNAGFGWNGPDEELPLERLREMLRLNVLSTAELTHRVLAAQRARRHGYILNVASTAAFLPVPYMAAYAASKAFVLSLTEALHVEARRDGVTVSALCPGYTRTSFHEAAGMRGAEATPFPEMTAEAVAAAGLKALEKGRAVAVTHPLDRLWILSGRLVPRSVPPRIAAAVFSRTRLPKG